MATNPVAHGSVYLEAYLSLYIVSVSALAILIGAYFSFSSALDSIYVLSSPEWFVFFFLLVGLFFVVALIGWFKESLSSPVFFSSASGLGCSRGAHDYPLG